MGKIKNQGFRFVYVIFEMSLRHLSGDVRWAVELCELKVEVHNGKTHLEVNSI